MTKRFGVIGCPISHSLSPVIHNHWLEKHGINNGSYEKIHVEVSDLSHFIEHEFRRYFGGINVTVPHKETVLSLCDEITDVAKNIGAVNTVINRNGVITGTNTDAFGFIENLDRHHSTVNYTQSTVLIIGAGGAARAAIQAFGDKKAKSVQVTNRTIAKAEALMGAFPFIQVVPWGKKENAISQSDIIVNTTSLGMKGQPELEITSKCIPNQAIVYDIVYNPKQTQLLKHASEKGCHIIGGIGMLLYQAVPAFETFFGVRPEVDDILISKVQL